MIDGILHFNCFSCRVLFVHYGFNGERRNLRTRYMPVDCPNIVLFWSQFCFLCACQTNQTIETRTTYPCFLAPSSLNQNSVDEWLFLGGTASRFQIHMWACHHKKNRKSSFQLPGFSGGLSRQKRTEGVTCKCRILTWEPATAKKTWIASFLKSQVCVAQI